MRDFEWLCATTIYQIAGPEVVNFRFAGPRAYPLTRDACDFFKERVVIWYRVQKRRDCGEGLRFEFRHGKVN
jgi:hypothetical protein